MVASALSSPVALTSPLHKGKVAVAKQPRDLAEKKEPKDPKPDDAPAPKPPPLREPTGSGVASFFRLGGKKK
jgi:hypothetical protein